MKKFYDLHIYPGKNIKKTLKSLEDLGWSGVCLVQPFNEKFPKFVQELSKVVKTSSLEIFSGAEIKRDIRKNSRTVLQSADLVLASGGASTVNREASECWEVDLLCHPEREDGERKTDYLNQKNSGLDQVMAKLLAEKKIALEINLFQLLTSQGYSRAKQAGRLRQNIILARKFSVPVVMTSGATNTTLLRAPLEMMAIGEFLGLTPQEARDALTTIPTAIIKKSRDRKNPRILLKGLEVLEWGEQTPQSKKMWGWY